MLLGKALAAVWMVANFSHSKDGMAPPFLVLPLHEAGHYIVQPVELGGSGGLFEGIDKTPPRVVITNDTGGYNGAEMANRV